MQIIDADISSAKCDVIVNASNGIGYCGGHLSKEKKQKGVAEGLNFFTKGLLEESSQKEIRKMGWFASVFGLRKGNYFVTEGCGLYCKKVYHAITMRFPACRTDTKTVKCLLNNLFLWIEQNKYSSVALPLLGCGNGGIKKEIVLSLIEEKAEENPNIQVSVFLGGDSKR